MTRDCSVNSGMALTIPGGFTIRRTRSRSPSSCSSTARMFRPTKRACWRQASGLAKELGLSEITASVLVRRGYGDPEVARAFLAGEQRLHDPFLLGDMGAAVERIRAAIAAGKRICVHGDYDVDGICATVLAVLRAA